MKEFKIAVLVIILAMFPAVPVLATDWAQWRGPFFNGSTDEKDLPASWSKSENIAWVRPLPGPSGATAVVSNDRVFVSSMVKGTSDFAALCLDANTGRQLWRKHIGSDSRRYPRNNMASPSPAADGKNVFFLYGNGELVGFDQDGSKLWLRNIEDEYGNLALKYGYSNSPFLYDGRLFVILFRRNKPYRLPEADGPLDSFIMAVEPKTGRTIWKEQRKTNVFDESFETYSTPVPFVRGGKVELLNTGGDFITSHDPVTGKELWRYEYLLNKVRDGRTIPSLVTGGGLIFGTRHKHNGLFALRPPGGNAAKIVWEFNEVATDCSTPLFYQGRVYVLDGIRRGKVVACLDAKTGRQYWQGRIGGSGPWWASLTAGDGKLYCINEDGDIVVLKSGGEKFEIIFKTKIDEPKIQSSISIANGHLYIRTAENLYCIGKNEYEKKSIR